MAAPAEIKLTPKGQVVFPLTDLRLTEQTAIGVLDGRYANEVMPLRQLFSTYALNRARIAVNVKYLEALSDVGILRPLTLREDRALNRIWKKMTIKDSKKMAEMERRTRHDVKAMEYSLKDKVKTLGLEMDDVIEMVRLALTSEDDTNLAYNLLIKQAKDDLLVPAGWEYVDALTQKTREWIEIPMLSRTHGREAPATTVGYQLGLYALRAAKKVKAISDTRLTAKMNGVTGNFHDQEAANQDLDWIEFSNSFVSSLGLEPLPFTTQIEPHDRWAELFDQMAGLNTVILTADQNLWTYNMLRYFFLQPRRGQIGSSAMPHKGRNPIDIERSEGNALWARGQLRLASDELPNSRLQRHLSDSTLTRNIGALFGFTLVTLASATSDIRDLQLRHADIENDITDNPAIVSSSLQTRLRVLGVPGAYEALDQLSQRGPLTGEVLAEYISGLKIPEDEKEYLHSLKPDNTGMAPELTEMMLDDIKDLKTGKSVDDKYVRV